MVDFLQEIMKLAGIEDEHTFTRSMLVNTQEEVTTVLSAASYLPQEYVTNKILTILGDGDQADDLINQMNADEIQRASDTDDETDDDSGNEDENEDVNE